MGVIAYNTLLITACSATFLLFISALGWALHLPKQHDA